MTPSNDASALQIQSQEPVRWSTGLCDCFEHPMNCCITCCCPCITFGQIAEIIDKGSPPCVLSGALYTLILCITGHACLCSCYYRSRMRDQYLLEGTACIDCLVHWFCEPCALCQEYRELKNKGFDVPSGWKGNLGKADCGETLPPGVQPGMSR